MKKTLLTMAALLAGQVAASCLLEYIEYRKAKQAQETQKK